MNIKKQALTSAAHSEFTLEALKQIAPSAFTEVRGADGELTHKVNFDTLRELLGDAIADTDEETFGFQWVGKQAAKRAAAEPTRQTLRPVVEDSADWDTTENLYIEGDNLEVLKLLQRGYLGKVKMIYIDPPYNTRNDFVYNDDFAMSRDEMDEAMGNLDEEDNRLRRNLDSNPRYHSDWCSMIYSRLLVARTLLANDGVIFISIDDNEVHHLRKICDEVFGARNFVGTITRKQSSGSKNDSGYDKIISTADYLLVFQKGDFSFKPILVKNKKSFSFTDEQGRFSIRALEMQGGGDTLPQRPKMGYSIYYKKDANEVKLLFDYDLGNTPVYELPNSDLLAQGYKCYRPRPRGSGDMALGIWRWGDATFKERFAEGGVYFDEERVYLKERASDNIEKYPEAILDQYLNTNGTNELKALFKNRVFSFPKPVSLIDYILRVSTSPDSLILDFFSGSATTAHAVMQLNAEDGGKRKYICVQLPEETPEGSEARKAGYGTICEIGKERIRRAGKAVLDGLNKEELKVDFKLAKFAVGKDVDKDSSLWEYIEDEVTRNEAKQELEDIKKRRDALDTGFRVLRVDSSNMEDVYFEPAALQQDNLFSQVDNVKPDRSELDLLFGCMVDWGVELSYPLRQEEIAGKHLHIVNEGALVACFDKEINLEAIRYVAELKPLRIIFRESCFATDADKLNIYEQFKQLCGWSDDDVYSRIHVL
jgi:DNA (cytosine-5-)-methyltransferase